MSIIRHVLGADKIQVLVPTDEVVHSPNQVGVHYLNEL
jgi:hypothetical protein